MRLAFCAIVVGSSLAGASTANAQWMSDSFHNFKQTACFNHAWPEPFVYQDRQAVAVPIGIMVHNGWRKQTLLSDYHFDEGTARLNLSGELKIKQILLRVPPQHQIIYIQRTLDPEITANRTAEVQQVASRLSGPYPPQVAVTNAVDDGWPASNVQAVMAKWQATVPDPRLPQASTEDTSQ